MEPLIALFLYPAAAGYIVLTRSPIYRVRSHGFSNSRLFVESVVWGLFLLYLSYAFIAALEFKVWLPIWEKNLVENVWSLWDTLLKPVRNEVAASPKPTDESVLAILIAFLYSYSHRIIYCWNNNFSAWFQNRMNRREIRERQYLIGPMDSLLVLSLEKFVPLQVTLKNRKVYIGLIVGLPHVSPNSKLQKFLNIQPLQSFTRDSENLSVSGDVTDYGVLYEIGAMQGVPLGDAQWMQVSQTARDIAGRMNSTVLENIKTGVMIDMDEILTISLWDSAVARNFRTPRSRRR